MRVRNRSLLHQDRSLLYVQLTHCNTLQNAIGCNVEACIPCSGNWRVSFLAVQGLFGLVCTVCGLGIHVYHVLFWQDSFKKWVFLASRYTATHYNTLQHTATYCNARNGSFSGIKIHLVSMCNLHTATHCNTLQHTSRHCNTLQHTATHCNTLQHTAVHCDTLRHTATHCNTLQHTATQETGLLGSKMCITTHCYTLQHTATHCNTLQRKKRVLWVARYKLGSWLFRFKV